VPKADLGVAWQPRPAGRTALPNQATSFDAVPLERVTKDTDRDFILTAEQAVEYGAVDEVITSRKILPELAVAATGGA
jgi:ATP-dependent Clp protease protease subunit